MQNYSRQGVKQQLLSAWEKRETPGEITEEDISKIIGNGTGYESDREYFLADLEKISNLEVKEKYLSHSNRNKKLKIDLETYQEGHLRIDFE